MDASFLQTAETGGTIVLNGDFKITLNGCVLVPRGLRCRSAQSTRRGALLASNAHNVLFHPNAQNVHQKTSKKCAWKSKIEKLDISHQTERKSTLQGASELVKVTEKITVKVEKSLIYYSLYFEDRTPRYIHI